MKHLKKHITVGLLALAHINCGAAVSPNGFQTGSEPTRCTYMADELTDWFGWRLHFTVSTDRDAYRWPDIVSNARTVSKPVPGSILVLDEWAGGSEWGHVAFVLSVEGD